MNLLELQVLAAISRIPDGDAQSRVHGPQPPVATTQQAVVVPRTTDDRQLATGDRPLATAGGARG